MKLHRLPFRLGCKLVGILSALLTGCTSPAETPLSDTFFLAPPKEYYPETWFHYIGGNLSKEGISADLEAIAASGISGIQLFHGQFGGEWPGVKEQIVCLSPRWDEHVQWTADECRRLGLNFTMQNCPGWAYAGGPWITPDNAMRQLTMSRLDVKSGSVQTQLPIPQPSTEEWRDYRDICVIAFPTPPEDSETPLTVSSVQGDRPGIEWKKPFTGSERILVPPSGDTPHCIEIALDGDKTLRSVVLPSIDSYGHGWCYDPQIEINIFALTDDKAIRVGGMKLPAANWQDHQPLTLACREAITRRYRVEIRNNHEIYVNPLAFYSASRKQNWESEAAFTLRTIVREEHPEQSVSSWIKSSSVVDLSDKMGPDGSFQWEAPSGHWTILRIGHVNTGAKNGPAPANATGWECNKLSPSGARANFNGYIGRLTAPGAVLDQGKLNGLLLDSWECSTQTWTPGLDSLFVAQWGYSLKEYLPSLFGFVVNDPETTARCLRDWRVLLNHLLIENFYGETQRMAQERGLKLSFETSSGDVFPGDILEYFKYADIPMCEFWQPTAENYVGSIEFKPVKPCVSAARMYGKPRVAAEAFTSFNLTWDEHPGMLKPVADYHMAEGVTHMVFHTFTHNPQVGFLPPGTAFGASIGTPFLRNQTWWPEMRNFTTYLARCNYLLEQGRPVSDVLMYLGDEQNHKPAQRLAFPAGHKYDYCNPDVLKNRLSVKNGMLTTPEGISYRILWLHDCVRMQPETLERIAELVRQGAVVMGTPPRGMASLSGGDEARQRFDKAVATLWTKSEEAITRLGKGKIYHSAADVNGVLRLEQIGADLDGDSSLRWMHRRVSSADLYFLSVAAGNSFSGAVTFRAQAPHIEWWNPTTGEITPATVLTTSNGTTTLQVDLPQQGSLFALFNTHPSAQQQPASQWNKSTATISDWQLTFPSGWGVEPASLTVSALQPWCDLPLSNEGKAFSGTAIYETILQFPGNKLPARTAIDLGEVNYLARVSLNDQPIATRWTPPYRFELTPYLKEGENRLKVEVISSWFNRLVYDAALPEASRKTWTISAPAANRPLRPYGLLGPVVVLEN